MGDGWLAWSASDAWIPLVSRSEVGSHATSRFDPSIRGLDAHRFDPPAVRARRAVPVEPPVATLALGHRPRRSHVQPGERLLYEEGGLAFPACPIRFRADDSAAFLPERTGVEVIGGPYLHASLNDQLHPVR